MRAIPMSEKPGLKQVLEDSAAEAEGDQAIRGSPVPNGLVKDSNVIRNDVAEPVNQELGSESPAADGVEDGDDRVPGDKGKVTEDSGKEEFVDCSEDYAMDEVDRLRLLLETTVSEKESLARQFEEEREAFGRELASLRFQLNAFTDPQPSIGESGNFVNTRWTELINECSGLVKTALEKRLQTEAAVRELEGVVFKKDQEIEELNAKVNEFSVLNDVVSIFLNSAQRFVEVSSEAQIEKDTHVEFVTNRMLASIKGVVDQQEMVDGSIGGKLAHVEQCTSILIQKLTGMLSEIEQLRQCLPEARSDLDSHELGGIFAAARDELFEHKRKEAEFVERLSHLEDENRKLIEELENQKGIVEMVNAALGQTKMELEQEKHRCANTREKLTMAVTKGKALVQQRDLLKQSIAEKTSQLEKCLIELQEKSSALEAAELTKEELIRSENSIASLQEIVSQKNAIIESLEEVMSQTGVPEELQSMDILERLRWLSDENDKLKGISLEFQNLRDAMHAIDLPEVISSSDLEYQVNWLRESFSQAEEEVLMLRNEITATKEVARKNIDHLTDSLSAELQAKEYLQAELDNLTSEYQEIVKKEQQVSLEKADMAKEEVLMLRDEITANKEVARKNIEDLTAALSAELQSKEYLQAELDNLTSEYQEIVKKEQQVSSEKANMVRMLLNVSGVVVDNEEVYEPSSDTALLIDRCIGKIKEQSSSSLDSAKVDAELFETIQTHLYVRDQKLMLCETLLEEETLVRSEVSNLSNELRDVSQILVALKEEKGTLQRDFERSEEKNTVLREKLSMAVKKGKGLVQDRENLKHRLDEKKSEIDKLQLELQQEQLALAECRDKISSLSADADRIPKLDADLVTMKEQRDQLEQFLLESNNMLQRVIESLDGIDLPVDPVFEEPVGKVKFIAGYINECQDAKEKAEQELGKVKEDVNDLAGKLAEAHSTIKSLENELSVAENDISQHVEQKREMEVGKTKVEKEFEKAIEEAKSQAIKYSEVCASKKSLEEALSLVENNISVLVSEKEGALAGRAAAETELEKVKEEVDIQTGKLTEAYKTIKLLEDSLSQVQDNVSLLIEQNNEVQIGRTNLEGDLKKLQDEARFHDNKVADAQATIKSLEDALLKAENDISVLEGEKKNAEEEILTLNSKLNTCNEELSGTNSSTESRSIEQSCHLHNLHLLLKDETLLSTVKRCFEKKFEGLKDMELILKNIKDRCVSMNLEELQRYQVLEEDSYATKSFSDGLDNIYSVEKDNGEASVSDADMSSYLKKTAEKFQLRDNILAENVERFSSSVDEFIANLLRNLQAIRDEVITMSENMESVKEKATNLEISKQEQEDTIASLENDLNSLLSSCTDATGELQFQVKNNLLELSSVPELEELKHYLFPETGAIGGETTETNEQGLYGSKYGKTAEMLSISIRKVKALIKQFESASKVAASTIEDLQSKLTEARTTVEKAVEERDLGQNRISKLDTDVEALQNSCSKLALRLEDYQSKEDKFNEKEAEVLSLRNALSMKEQEAEDSLLSASEIKILFDKISGIEIPMPESHGGDSQPHISSHVNKLFYVIDSISDLQHQINLLSYEKDELQSTLGTRNLEIEQLKEEVESYDRDRQGREKMKNELSLLIYSLEKIIDMSGGNDLVGDQKSSGVTGLLSVLEKQVRALQLESESSKSKAQELGTKLGESQKIVEELSTVVNSLQGRAAQSEIVQDRSIFEAPSLPTGSEISEIEDGGSHGKNGISPVQSAAHVRTMRKGSTDHLAIEIGSESTRLLNSEETDEDKGHVFKSLNASGLIPRQGKLVADRIDGIWVSGGRVLMSRPRARLGLIVYWLFLHLWLLGTIL
ncbi:trans-Golgi network-localized SYP41-interacting protein 1-like isoform X2 [Malus sylvestris]|uniref:trans-Golgi network-localized SYP41-interacting protein 1-like isoform X2 n=1 Tax=Malus sylvestris TaxID=3752 RepID=UPI0021AC9253|nr:trans-Golgi network-localized SYP41-interacting protein 1-like isoform X2 [Malus sylvestris]